MKQQIDRLLRALWLRACRWDKLPTNTNFVVFSDANPHVKRLNKMVALKQAAIRSGSSDGSTREL